MIPHNRLLILPEDRAAVDAVLASGWIAQGPAVATLEKKFIQDFGGGSACALSSGTAALFLALKALGAGRGDVVALPTYACSALLNAVYMAGATPSLVDVLLETFCLDPAAMSAQAPGARFVVPVHTYGAIADIAALKSQGLVVVEDCCQSIGGTDGGGLIGAAGDAAVFSFYASKIVTGGQGGLVWSRNVSVSERARDYRQFDGRDSYEHRFNLQMTDIQAGLISSQMTRLAGIRAKRSEIASTYLSALPKGLSTQAGITDEGRMAHRFVVLAPTLAAREGLRLHMAAEGVECRVPIERFELLHRYLKADPAFFSVSERLADTTLSLPIHPSLSDEEVSVVAQALDQFRP